MVQDGHVTGQQQHWRTLQQTNVGLSLASLNGSGSCCVRQGHVVEDTIRSNQIAVDLNCNSVNFRRLGSSVYQNLRSRIERLMLRKFPRSYQRDMMRYYDFVLRQEAFKLQRSRSSIKSKR